MTSVLCLHRPPPPAVLPPCARHSLATPSIWPSPPCPPRVRPCGQAPSGGKSNNCLSAQQSSFKSEDETKTYSDKQNWEGIASGRSARTCRGSRPADKEDSREEGGGQKEAGAEVAVGMWARLNGHRLTISDQEQAWCLENRVDTA